MTIGIRGGTPLVVGTTSNPISGTLTGTRQPQAGDVLHIIHGNNFFALSNMPTPTVGGSTSGVTALAGTADGGTDNAHIKQYRYTVGSSGDLTVEVTETGSADEEKCLIIYVLTGVDTSNVLDGTPTGGSGGPSVSHTSPAITDIATTSAYMICHTNTGGGSSSGSYTPPTDMTEQYDQLVGGGMSMSGATQQLTASGDTGTKVFTSGSTAWAAVSAAYRTLSGTNANAEAATASVAANDATVSTTNIRKIADRGSLSNVTTGTTSAVDLAAGGSIAVGNYLIARVALDNAGTNGAAPTLSVSDPGGNTWTVAGPANIDPGAANAGATCYIAYAKITTGLANGDDVTLTYNVSVPAKAIVVEEWTNIHATTPVAVAATTATGTSTTPSISRTPTASTQMFYGAIAVEGPSGDTFTQDTDTTDGSWVTLTRVASADATATNNQTINGVYKVVSGTTAQTWNPTITSRDWAAVALVFEQAVAATNATAENAAATVSAEVPSPRVSVTTDVASFALAGNDATVSTGGGVTNANAEVAGIGLAMTDPASGIGASAELVALTVSAGDLTTAGTHGVDVAVAGIVANDVVASIQASAGVATLTQAGQDITPKVSPGAEVALITAEALFDATGGSVGVELVSDGPILVPIAANNATVSTAPQAFANAEVAALTIVAEALGVLTTATASEASVGVIANAPQASVGVQPASADVVVSALDTSAKVAAAIEVATFVLSALDASVQTGGFANANAEAAALGLSAESLTTLIRTNSEAAAFGLQAEVPSGSSSASVSAEVALLTVAGVDTASGTSGSAEAATLAAVANGLGAKISANIGVAVLVVAADNTSVVTGTYGWPLQVGAPFTALKTRSMWASPLLWCCSPSASRSSITLIY